MLNFIKNHQKRLLILYCYSYFLYGIQFTTIGPMLPFLSDKSNKGDTQFIYLLTIRGITYLLAGLGQRFIFNRLQPHKKLFFALLSIGISFILAEHTVDKIYIGILAFIFSYGACLIDILALTLTLQVSKQEKRYWSSILLLSFNIGSIFAPIIISIYGLKQFKIVGVIFVASSFLYLFKLFGYKQTQEKISLRQTLIPNDEQNNIKEQMPKCATYCYFFIFLTFASYSLSYRSLISSYAVMTNTMSKSQASFALSAYNISITGSLIIFTFLQIDMIKTLRRLNLIGIAMLMISSVVQYTQYRAYIIYLSGIVLGGVFGPLYPILFSIPNKFGIKLKNKDTSLFVIGYSIGQSVICALVGYGMLIIGPQSLFFMILLIALAMKQLSDFSIKIMRQHGKIFNNYRSTIVISMRQSLARSIAFSNKIQ